MSGALSFFGYFFLGIGPGIVFFIFIIAPKSFLVLLSFCSTFYWLLTLLFTSLIFRGFLPIAQTAGSYAGVLLGSVVIQEAARYLLWRCHELVTRVLDDHSSLTGHRFDLIDKLYLALGWGYGHGAAHVIFFVLSFLPMTTGDGTWYYDQCPSMSIFLAGCLYALAFGMLLPSLMVIAFDGYQQKNYLHIVYVPLMHLGASLLTLINFQRYGCNISFPLLLAIGALNVFYAGLVSWRKGPHKLPPSPGTTEDPHSEMEETSSQAHLVHDTHDGQAGGARRRPRAPAGSQFPLVGTD